jgi:hypothetical protein
MISSSVAALGLEEKRFLTTFDQNLTSARKSYQAFVEKDLHRRTPRPAGRTPAWEIWQEQFLWILELLADRAEAVRPLAPEKTAIYIASRAGIPLRAMAKVLGHSDGRLVSEIIRQTADRLANNQQLMEKVESLQIL